MATNTKPQLIILIDETKRDALRDYSKDRKVSMGFLVNQLIDRLLAGEIDVVEKQSVAYREPLKTISIEEITNIINQAILPIEERLATVEEMASLQSKKIAEIKKAFSRPQVNKTTVANNPPQSTNVTTGGMTRKEFAKFIGVSGEAIRKWEKGERKPSEGNADLFDRWEIRDGIWYPILKL